ncbi:MAG: hypothetical protein HYV46_01930 [candidate division NC10 bacterium]|nr:hypothetical protein [candidate division NC10 bacterium]
MKRRVIYPSENRVTAQKLERAGIDVCRVPFSELAKAEAGVTCCSVIFDPDYLALGGAAVQFPRVGPRQARRR